MDDSSRDDPQDERGILGDLHNNIISMNMWPSYTAPVVYIRFRTPYFLKSFKKRMCLRITKARDMAFEYSLMERKDESRRFKTTCPLFLESFKSHGLKHNIRLTSAHHFDSPNKIDIKFVWEVDAHLPPYKDVWVRRGGILLDMHLHKVESSL